MVVERARAVGVETGADDAMMVARVAMALRACVELGQHRKLAGKGGPNTWARRLLREPDVIAWGKSTGGSVYELEDGQTIDPFPVGNRNGRTVAAQMFADLLEKVYAQVEDDTWHGSRFDRALKTAAPSVVDFLEGPAGAVLLGHSRPMFDASTVGEMLGESWGWRTDGRRVACRILEALGVRYARRLFEFEAKRAARRASSR